MAKKTKNFISKIDQVCGNDKTRPAMQGIFFKNVYLYATDAHILIRHDLSLHGFKDSELRHLQDVWIHKDVFKKIFSYDYVEAHKDHFLAYNKKRTVKAKFEYEEYPGRYPDIEAVIPDDVDNLDTASGEFGINTKILSRLSNALIDPENVILKKIDNRMILIKSKSCEWESETALIMQTSLKK